MPKPSSLEFKAAFRVTRDHPKTCADVSLDQSHRLFACHLRTRLMLRDVMEAEREIPTRIVETLATFPEARREELMTASIAGAADGLVYG